MLTDCFCIIIMPFFRFPPFAKGGKGGVGERLKIPLNPPFSKGDSTAFFRSLPPTAGFLSYCFRIQQQPFPNLHPLNPQSQVRPAVRARREDPALVRPLEWGKAQGLRRRGSGTRDKAFSPPYNLPVPCISNLVL